MKNEEEFMFSCIIRKPKIYSVISEITAQDLQDALAIQEAAKNLKHI